MRARGPQFCQQTELGLCWPFLGHRRLGRISIRSRVPILWVEQITRSPLSALRSLKVGGRPAGSHKQHTDSPSGRGLPPTINSSFERGRGGERRRRRSSMEKPNSTVDGGRTAEIASLVQRWSKRRALRCLIPRPVCLWSRERVHST